MEQPPVRAVSVSPNRVYSQLGRGVMRPLCTGVGAIDPTSFGGQLEHSTGRVLDRRELRDELLAVPPIHVFDRRFAARVLEERRVVACHLLPLTLGHLVLAHVERSGQCHMGLRALLRPAVRHVHGVAHQEIAWRNQPEHDAGLLGSGLEWPTGLAHGLPLPFLCLPATFSQSVQSSVGRVRYWLKEPREIGREAVRGAPGFGFVSFIHSVCSFAAASHPWSDRGSPRAFPEAVVAPAKSLPKHGCFPSLVSSRLTQSSSRSPRGFGKTFTKTGSLPIPGQLRSSRCRILS